MSAVTKDGDIGVAANAKRPIEKLLSTNQSNFSHLHQTGNNGWAEPQTPTRFSLQNHRQSDTPATRLNGTG